MFNRDLLGVCVKDWRICPGICIEFEPLLPSRSSIRSLRCRFRQMVYLSTEELKDLVRRKGFSENLPWRELG